MRYTCLLSVSDHIIIKCHVTIIIRCKNGFKCTIFINTCCFFFISGEGVKEKADKDGIQRGGVRQRRDAEDSGSALSGRLPLPGVSGDLYGASDTALHTHLLQGNTHTRLECYH